jgi:hypothetical protein
MHDFAVYYSESEQAAVNAQNATRAKLMASNQAAQVNPKT